MYTKDCLRIAREMELESIDTTKEITSLLDNGKMMKWLKEVMIG